MGANMHYLDSLPVGEKRSEVVTETHTILNITEPLPNCFSICASAAASALLLSELATAAFLSSIHFFRRVMSKLTSRHPAAVLHEAVLPAITGCVLCFCRISRHCIKKQWSAQVLYAA